MAEHVATLERARCLWYVTSGVDSEVRLARRDPSGGPSGHSHPYRAALAPVVGAPFDLRLEARRPADSPIAPDVPQCVPQSGTKIIDMTAATR
ncbi:MAG TPA: hypothetical protein VHB69_02800 [Mycobacteriales bacterium]|nr:hypothetical protein [Mycobacteriales bacterium]